VHPEVEPDLRGRVAHQVGQRRVLDVHHQHSVPASHREQASQLRPHLGVHRHVDSQRSERAVGGDEILLHVHEQQGRAPRVGQFAEFCADVLAFESDQRPPSSVIPGWRARSSPMLACCAEGARAGSAGPLSWPSGS